MIIAHLHVLSTSNKSFLRWMGDKNSSWLSRCRYIVDFPVPSLVNASIWIAPEHRAGPICHNTKVSFFTASYKGKMHLCVCWHSALFWGFRQTPYLRPTYALACVVQWDWEYGCFWRPHQPLDCWCRSCDSHSFWGSFPWSDLYQYDLSWRPCLSPSFWGKGRNELTACQGAFQVGTSALWLLRWSSSTAIPQYFAFLTIACLLHRILIQKWEWEIFKPEMPPFTLIQPSLNFR